MKREIRTVTAARTAAAQRRRVAPWCALLTALLLALPGLAQTPRPTPAAATRDDITSTPPVKVRAWVGERDQDLTLIGFDSRNVYFAKAAQRSALAKAEITRAVFDFDLYSAERSKAERKRDWTTVARILSPRLKPTLPYLDLPDNNAAEPVLYLGTVMMRAADRSARLATTEEQRAVADAQYAAAATVFNDAARATWSPVGLLADLKRCRCLIARDKPKSATYYLGQIDEPFPGDAAFGIYWIVQGELAYLSNDHRTAMDAAVKSLTFENKDVETFPDALLLSARCYEHFEEWHRARDVYYEVASIFPQTDWADDAAERLTYILAEELTEADETSPLENVFFGVTEDVNKLARELLERRRNETDDTEEADTGPPEE